jgi:hypothetical protein
VAQVAEHRPVPAHMARMRVPDKQEVARNSEVVLVVVRSDLEVAQSHAAGTAAAVVAVHSPATDQLVDTAVVASARDRLADAADRNPANQKAAELEEDLESQAVVAEVAGLHPRPKVRAAAPFAAVELAGLQGPVAEQQGEVAKVYASVQAVAVGPHGQAHHRRKCTSAKT